MIDFPTLLGRFAYRPGDSEDIRTEKAAIALVAGSCCCAGVVWTSMYLATLGLCFTSVLPAVFVLIVGTALLVSHRTGNHYVAVYAQILCIMYITALIQWTIGGLFASGFVLGWAFCGPFTALMFFDLRRSYGWFALYLLNILITVVFDGWFESHALPVTPVVRSLFFFMNMSVSSFVVFSFAAFFVSQRQSARERLVAEHARVVSSQQALVRSEKLAALGQLVAGVAHELNTPLGAIRALVGTMTVTASQLPQQLPAAMSSASPEARGLLDRLLALPHRTQPLSPREERAARRAMTHELEAAGVAWAGPVADRLVEVGWEGDVAPIAPVLMSEQGARVLVAARELRSLRQSAANIQLAAERAAKIVFALKTYAHPGAADRAGLEASIAENLDIVVLLYQNQIKQGVEIVRDYADPGQVVARHDELNQVWTNLLHNALQAMSNRGHLRLGVHRDGGFVRVSVEDDGPGIAPQHQARLFEPFFTTKPAGEGSGLGLSICRKIVSEHGGTLEFESRPGRTVFTAVLPVGGGGE